jgi:hypothetical protein
MNLGSAWIDGYYDGLPLAGANADRRRRSASAAFARQQAHCAKLWGEST